MLSLSGARRARSRPWFALAILSALALFLVNPAPSSHESRHPWGPHALADYTYGQGYVEAGANGGAYAFGGATFWGSIQTVNPGKTAQSWLGAPIVGIAEMPGGGGYWMAASNGAVCAFGSATGWAGLPNNPSSFANYCGYMLPGFTGTIVGIAADPAVSNGYWLVDNTGAMYAGIGANLPNPFDLSQLSPPVNVTNIVAITPAPSGTGWWLAGSDGGVYAMGSAQFEGSMSGKQLNKPIVGIAAGPNDASYWVVGGDGGVFNFGVPQYGTLALTSLYFNIQGVASTGDGGGFYLMAFDGSLFTYGDAQFQGDIYGNGQYGYGQIVGVAVS